MGYCIRLCAAVAPLAPAEKTGILVYIRGGGLVAREDHMTFEELTEIVAMLFVAGLAMALFGCYLTAQII